MNLPSPFVSLPPDPLLMVGFLLLQTSSTSSSRCFLLAFSTFPRVIPWSPLLPAPSAVNSYGDDDTSSSSGSEDEVQKQFEISVTRSQSFRAGKSGEAPTRQVSVSRRQKFSRLSDQEEGSTEPSDCGGETFQNSFTRFTLKFGTQNSRNIYTQKNATGQIKLFSYEAEVIKTWLLKSTKVMSPGTSRPSLRQSGS